MQGVEPSEPDKYKPVKVVEKEILKWYVDLYQRLFLGRPIPINRKAAGIASHVQVGLQCTPSYAASECDLTEKAGGSPLFIGGGVWKALCPYPEKMF